MEFDKKITIHVDNVVVDYKVYVDKHMTLRHLASAGFSGREATVVNALKGVTNTIYRGEVIGVLGSNGSGKSTLLSAIAGLVPLASGSVLVRSEPALLGVNAALKPELSGHRNIEIGGLAMGLQLQEINKEFKKIEEFTELGDALSRPLRTYSSGMRARLAFSIATVRTPEILLIDEALAVGDKSFREKSLKRVREMQAEAGTIVMVTHNLEEIKKTCTRALWLENGHLKLDGEVDFVIDSYKQSSLAGGKD